jgi:lysophospholipase L1-like esterase
MLFTTGCSNHNNSVQGTGKNAALSTSTPSQTPDDKAAQPTTDASTLTPAATVDVIAPTLTPDQLPKAPTSYLSDEMYQNADLNDGDLARLAAVMKKARDGEEITVGVIGGSITQGSLATANNGYGNTFYKWWTEAFPDTKVNFINAGLGGTTSYLGVHRVDKDLLIYNPDVVVVEFSVNDSDSLFYKETYEDLVRRILKQTNNPAVIQLFMTQEDGTSAQAVHLHVGFWYNLPRLSYREMILPEIEKGTFTWKDISPDNIHPNDKGHAMAGEILWNYLNSVYAKLDTISEEVTPLDKAPQFSEAYIDATILDSSNLSPTSLGSFTAAKVYERFPNDWTTQTGSETITFETEAQNIGIMYLKTTDGLSGQFDVSVDGTKVWTLDADFSGGWGNYPDTVEVYKSKDKVKHTIEIKKSSSSTGDVFTILGLLIS